MKVLILKTVVRTFFFICEKKISIKGFLLYFKESTVVWEVNWREGLTITKDEESTKEFMSSPTEKNSNLSVRWSREWSKHRSKYNYTLTSPFGNQTYYVDTVLYRSQHRFNLQCVTEINHHVETSQTSYGFTISYGTLLVTHRY